jgi:hypothetical protein
VTTTAARAERWRANPSGLPFEPVLLQPAGVAALRAAFARDGFAVLGPPAIEPELHDALVAESVQQRRVAAWELRGAGPAELDQDNVRAHLGPLARQLVASSALRGLLSAVTGHVVIPGWSATCLTFYDRPGQHLGRHRDKRDGCQYAVLIYLDAAWPGDTPGPGLQLHVERYDGDPAPTRITARRNRIVVLHGARLAHYRPPLGADESAALVAACYAVVA